MLIVTSNVLSPFDAAVLARAWPGPKVLIVLPGSGLAEADLRALPDEFLVIDCLQPPDGTLAIFQDLIGVAPQLLADLDGPILFLDRPMDALELAGRVRACAGSGTEIAAVFDPDGRIVDLCIGDFIATNPLFPEFFALLGGHSIDDSTLIELMQEAFAWTSV